MAREDCERQMRSNYVVFGECGDYKMGFPYKQVIQMMADAMKIGPQDVEKLMKEVIECQEIVEEGDNFCVKCFVDRDVIENAKDYLEEIEEE